MLEAVGILAVAAVVWLVVAVVRDWWSSFTRRNRAKLRAVPVLVAFVLLAAVSLDRWAVAEREQVVVVAASVLAGSLFVAAVSVLALWRRETTRPRPRGTPEAPVEYRHDPSVTSGVYFLTLRHRHAPDEINHWKIGKSNNVDGRIGDHRTITGDVLVEEGRIHTSAYHALENRVHADLRRWRIEEPGVTAVELYEPTPEVAAYVHDALRKAGA